MLSNNMAYVYTAYAGGKFQLVSNFTELHALTLATRSYAFLLLYSLLPRQTMVYVTQVTIHATCYLANTIQKMSNNLLCM